MVAFFFNKNFYLLCIHNLYGNACSEFVTFAIKDKIPNRSAGSLLAGDTPCKLSEGSFLFE